MQRYEADAAVGKRQTPQEALQEVGAFFYVVMFQCSDWVNVSCLLSRHMAQELKREVAYLKQCSFTCFAIAGNALAAQGCFYRRATSIKDDYKFK